MSELAEATARATDSEERLAALQVDQSRLQGLLDTAPTHEKLEALRRESAETTSRADDLEKRERLLAENEQVVEMALEATKGLVDRNAALAMENAEMLEQVRTTNDGVETFTDRIRDLEHAVAGARENSEQLERELLEEQQRLAQAEDAIRATQAETHLERQARLDDAHLHQHNIAGLEAQRDKAQRWCTNAAEEASALKRELAEQTALRSQAERSAQAAQTTAARDRRAYDQVHARNIALANEEQAISLQRDRLAGRVEQLSTDVADLKREQGELSGVTDEAMDALEGEQRENDRLRALLSAQEAQAEKVAEAAQRRLEGESAAFEEAQRLKAEPRVATPPPAASVAATLSKAETPPPAAPVAATLSKAETSDEDELGALVGALGELNRELEDDPDDAAQVPLSFQVPKKYKAAMGTNRDLLKLGQINETETLLSDDNFLVRKYEEGASMVRKNNPTERSTTNYNAWRKGTFARLDGFIRELQKGVGQLNGDRTALVNLLLQPQFPFFAVDLLAYENLLGKAVAMGDTGRAEYKKLAATLRVVRELRVQLTHLANTVVNNAEYR